MHVCVVGGAGFVGSHLVDRLLAEGHTVDVVDDLSSGALSNLGEARAAAAGALKFHHLDVRTDAFAELVTRRRPEVVYDLAILPPGRRGRSAGEATIGGLIAVLEAARTVGIPKVVATVPAVALYGTPPARELPVREGRVVEQPSVDGVLARAVVDLLAAYRAEHNVEYTALATASVYGPRQRPDGGVVGAFVHAVSNAQAPVLAGDGRQTRDFVFIDDTVDALVRASQRGSGLVINIGTGQQTTVRDVWGLLAAPSGAAPVLRPGEDVGPARFALSVVRARLHLGWEPWTTIDAGLGTLRSGQDGS